MADLPQGADLIREPKSGATPGVRVRPVDYSPLVRGSRAIEQGGKSIAAGINVAIKEAEEAQDFETKKRLADFRLQTEAELEEYRKTMPPGAAGWSEGWAKTYDKRATDFVKRLPEPQKDKVQAALIQQHERLQGHAQALARAEAERHEEEGLGQTLTSFVGRVDRDPQTMRESRTEGRKLIESSNLSLARKQVLLKNYRGQIEKTAVEARLSRARTAADYAEIAKDLSGKDRGPEWASDLDPGQPGSDRGSGPLAQSYLDRIKKSEGYTAKAAWDVKQHSIGYGTKARSADEKITKEEAERRFTEEITEARAIVDQAAPGVPEGIKAALTSLTFNAGSAWIKQGLGKAIAAGDYEKAKKLFLQYNKARDNGKLVYNDGLARRRQREVKWFDEDGSTTESPDDYAGPYKNLSPAERTSYRRRIAVEYQRQIKQLDTAITKLESGAMEGILPAELVTDLQIRVDEADNPALKAKLAVTIATANEMKQRYERPPEQNIREATAYRTRVMSSKAGATPEQLERLKKLEQFAQTQARIVRDDKLTWAFRSGVEQVAQLPADLNDAGRMAARLEHVTGAAGRFGGGLQYFTKPERSSLSNAINAGDVSVVGIARSMVQHWGMEHANRAIRELAKDAPEAVIAGWLVTNNVNPQAASDIDGVLRARKDPNYKKPQTALRAQDREDEAKRVLGDAFDRFPQPQRMAIMRATDLLYEARNKEPGVADGELYRQSMQELLGQRAGRDGYKFGGLIDQSTSYWSGNKNTIIVPPTWRQDTVKDVLSSVTREDLEEAGLTVPVDRNGKPIPITRAMTATLVPAGAELGVYYLSLGDAQTPGQENYALHAPGGEDDEGDPYEPTPYVLDLNKLEPVLRKRMPSRFWSD